jgi:hypothetical protein
MSSRYSPVALTRHSAQSALSVTMSEPMSTDSPDPEGTHDDCIPSVCNGTLCSVGGGALPLLRQTSVGCLMMPQKGDRVRLVHTSDYMTKLQAGALGTVRKYRENVMDEYDQLHVDWDDGSGLSLIPESGDRWEIVK